MPLTQKPLSDRIEAVRGDFAGRFHGADVRSRRSRLDKFAQALGRIHYVIDGMLMRVAAQLLPDTAEVDWLVRHGSLRRIVRKTASYATGSVIVSGDPELFVPEGSVWQRADGEQYVQDAAVEIGSSGQAEVVVTAAIAGASGNSDAGVTLTSVSPRAGMSSTAVVAELGIGAGADAENDDELRARVIDRMRAPPHGGNAADYRQWATAVPGVTRAWVFPRENGPGTVVVRFMMDRQREAGIPLPEDVVAVQAAIDDAHPVPADVNVAGPEPVPLSFVVESLSPPASQVVRDAIEAELRDLIQREAIPGGTLLISHIREAISVAAGEQDHVLSSPTENQTVPSYQVITFGGITWG